MNAYITDVIDVLIFIAIISMFLKPIAVLRVTVWYIIWVLFGPDTHNMHNFLLYIGYMVLCAIAWKMYKTTRIKKVNKQ